MQAGEWSCSRFFSGADATKYKFMDLSIKNQTFHKKILLFIGMKSTQ